MSIEVLFPAMQWFNRRSWHDHLHMFLSYFLINCLHQLFSWHTKSLPCFYCFNHGAACYVELFNYKCLQHLVCCNALHPSLTLFLSNHGTVEKFVFRSTQLNYTLITRGWFHGFFFNKLVTTTCTVGRTRLGEKLCFG